MQHGVDRFVSRASPSTQRLVKTFATQSRVLGDLRHAPCLGDIAERGEKNIRIWVFGGGREVFRDHLVVIEIGRGIEGGIGGLHFFSFSSAAMRFARPMSLRCDDLSPPVSNR